MIMHTSYRGLRPSTRALAAKIEFNHDHGFTWKESEDLAKDEMGHTDWQNLKEQKVLEPEINYTDDGKRMIALLEQNVRHQRAILDRVYAEVEWARDHSVPCVNLSGLYWALSGMKPEDVMPR